MYSTIITQMFRAGDCIYGTDNSNGQNISDF